MMMVDPGVVVRVEAISNYSRIYFSNGKTLVVAKVLRWFEEAVGDKRFFRVHRTHLVNSSFIKEYIQNPVRPEGGGTLFLTNGDRIEVSKRRRSLFLKSWYEPMPHSGTPVQYGPSVMP
ncbi:MAG: LytTR family transcriptional regulator [Chitinophagaceae bacterium]|nr:LytTR family transcriptional regulator [Chitinophagaceae bacterium]